jgi:hypothetical protein
MGSGNVRSAPSEALERPSGVVPDEAGDQPGGQASDRPPNKWTWR